MGGWCKCYLACFPIRAKSASQPWAGEAASSTSRTAAIPQTFLKSLHIILTPPSLSSCSLTVFSLWIDSRSRRALACQAGGGRHSTDSLVHCRPPALTHTDKPPAAAPTPVLGGRFLHVLENFKRVCVLDAFPIGCNLWFQQKVCCFSAPRHGR